MYLCHYIIYDGGRDRWSAHLLHDVICGLSLAIRPTRERSRYIFPHWELLMFVQTKQIVGAGQVVYVLGVSVEINQPTNEDHMIVIAHVPHGVGDLC